MERKLHWEKIYGAKQPTEVSWFAPHLETSLKLIDVANMDRDPSIIDIGGGASTLVDDLIERGFKNITVLDISSVALKNTKARLGEAGAGVL